MSRVFVDTNILVYSVDSRHVAKQIGARSALLAVAGDATISTQVLQEFYVVVTKRTGLPAADARRMIQAFMHDFDVVSITPEMVDRAIGISLDSQLSFWDALLFAAASSAQCDQLWSEDLSDGQIINGIRVVNPLKV